MIDRREEGHLGRRVRPLVGGSAARELDSWGPYQCRTPSGASSRPSAGPGGMSAAAQIVEEGGLIIVASECRDGFPEHGNYRKLLFEYNSPDALLKAIHEPGFSVFDQWQVQLQALICQKARVGVKSLIDSESLRRAHLMPVESINEALQTELNRIGRDAPVAVLPEGPVTVPYLL